MVEKSNYYGSYLVLDENVELNIPFHKLIVQKDDFQHSLEKRIELRQQRQKENAHKETIDAVSKLFSEMFE